MFLPIVCVALFISKVAANGELVILHNPSSLAFKGHDHVKESIIAEIQSASLGFSTEKYSNWNGLHIENPFDLPEAVVTVVVDGVSEIGISEGHHYPLRTDEEESNVYSALERRVLERYPEGNSNLVRINLADGIEEISGYGILKGNHKAKKLIHHHLKLNVDEDRAVVNDITLLNTIANAVKDTVHSDHIPDIFWFKIDTLHALTDLYGENSTQVTEAKQLLVDAILHIRNAFEDIYDGKVLVNLISSDAIHTRKTRNILADEGEPTGPKVNPAKHYGKDYPVIFNIILWFGVAMFFSVLAVCLAIATMDPGRDSIIYRMTSTRLKKDN